jgi:hypothetical protein
MAFDMDQDYHIATSWLPSISPHEPLSLGGLECVLPQNAATRATRERAGPGRVHGAREMLCQRWREL